MVLIDSSIWIDYFRNGTDVIGDLVDTLIDKNDVAVTGIIELELYQGARPEERKILSELFHEIHYVPTKRAHHIAAGIHVYDLRRKGITLPPSDVLIAAICMEEDLSLLTLDKHFSQFSDLSILPIHS